MTNKRQIWCLERTDPKTIVHNLGMHPMLSYWATDHWIDHTTKGCTLMTERAARVLRTEYRADKTDHCTYEIRRV